jgi:GNAT superfamily N-acetyltransferase
MAVQVRPYRAAGDAQWAAEFLDTELGGRWQARRGALIDVLAPALGFVAERDGSRCGLAAYRLEPAAAELSVLVAEPRRQGIGAALLSAASAAVRAAGLSRIWVVTTNDNLDALRFYQRRGFRLLALRPAAVDAARRSLKPSIGTVGSYGIPLRDELELVLDLDEQPATAGPYLARDGPA